MATVTGTSGATQNNYAVAHAGNYEDIYGFDNAPNNTNLPQIYEREVTVFGNRTLMGFLRMIGAEMPTNSREIRWAEQRRLHVFYNRVRRVNAAGEDFTIHTNDMAGTLGSSTIDADHSVREGDKVLIGDGNDTFLAIASDVVGGVVTLKSFTEVASLDAGFSGLASGSNNLTLLVVGSEFDKGTDGRSKTIQPSYDSYTNNTVIMKETFSVNGSDANQIGWVEIADENGVQGKYWYIKGKSEAMTRFEDYAEIELLEDQKVATNADGSARTGGTANGQVPAKGADGTFTAKRGSEGLFSAIRTRGLSASGGIRTSNTNFLLDLDMFVKAWDKEGNIEENLWYLNRDQSLNFDNGMAAQSNGGQATNTSWGLFNNSKDMALNLGFTGVRRGSYDIYKKDWKYLNQVDGRSTFGDVQGVSIPMGSKSVYNEYGQNLQSPFASIHYLAGAHSNRKMQTWVHGGQAPNHTNGEDSFNIEWLTERCINVKGANNFGIFVA